MAISKKKQAQKKASKAFVEKCRAEVLKKVGYDKLYSKHGGSSRPSLPNYKVESKYQLSNSVANGFKKRSGADHPDAQVFSIIENHKQGPMLHTGFDDIKFAGGKKT